MIDFQKIRNKQKWLFGIIAIPVIIGFVVMFTPDATDTLLGRNSQRSQQVNFGEINKKPVSKDQWLNARGIVISRFGVETLSRMINQLGDDYLDRMIIDTLVEMEMLERYTIRPTTSDALDLLVEQIKAEALRRGLSTGEVAQNMTKQTEASLIRLQKYLIGTEQLRQLAGIADGLVSEKEAEIQFREENEF